MDQSIDNSLLACHPLSQRQFGYATAGVSLVAANCSVRESIGESNTAEVAGGDADRASDIEA